jgi:hypothetical protein
MLPPGRAMLATSPIAIGSMIIVTIGTVVVAILKSNDRRPPAAKIRFSGVAFHHEVLALDVAKAT